MATGYDENAKRRGLLTVWNQYGGIEVNTGPLDPTIREIRGVANTGDCALVVTGVCENDGPFSNAFLARVTTGGFLEPLQVAQGKWADEGEDVAPMVLSGKAPQGYVFAGVHGVTANNPDGWLVKYKNDGAPAGDFKWGLAGTDHFRAVDTAQGGAIVVGGDTTSYGSGGTNGAVLRFDHNLGLIW